MSCALLLPVAAVGAVERFDGATFLKVEGSADTLLVQTDDQRLNTNVRLSGIRAPKRGEPWWAYCAAQVARFLEGRALTVIVDSPTPDPAVSTVIGRIYLDRGQIDVSASLVRSGCAAVTEGSNSWLLDAQRAAQAENLRIWVDPPGSRPAVTILD